ncbi:YdeI/OmpD-associated family protein [Hamadaea sp. NPDC051192]|uniref:YdeI/OmpD-associated family protein n=1 Tax=Hamadaea sp. NPDC051192 TaxID=3154940 RepID=UPI00341DC17C
MKFQAVIELHGKTATGIVVPDEVVEALAAGKRPAVRATIREHTYETTIAPMGGRFLMPVSSDVRAAAGVAAGDEVEVTVEVDASPRQVEVPDDLAAALDAVPAARKTFDGLSVSLRKYHVTQVTGAKTDETRQRRIEKSVATLAEGRAR